ncbi:DNA-binding HxlR family transcriptional regulator [Agrobacterium tumefaciens]|jgi:DNA-binding HxlR family transcriptional regulator|uniref:Helix-turn-helix transcriptional regulator n=1 Tax=Agrobacterium tumefaciens TaxID=358 RepID=A0AAP9E7B4_AGRTU|nr:helix-turn-helix domain-containing protein [Agrobacterium tumefaciens]MBP2509056.1 DNA-binding HxlR family transcriptional regulator [Agrobacterium tumefaciens]MBP2518208.1 DNA-binding HxlR family transcriptional regulator [Agrobacterium tumefaciens]MBP2573415.1 DNA-binding HxlR family transcriptional regulator [Agrobacterium tumefaciens]MBP2576841.1 DNA-binding HxlR family transcriptional regulator [Agrobacterium tumefaciens]MBP2594977.1 DNA-binding HxlR family transcriptional regulator [A
MENSSVPQCPVARGLDYVGDAWSILVLRDAHAGLTRFDQFRKSLGIVPTMLTKRLKALTEDGLLEKRLYSEKPPRDEYILTDAGRDFLPVLMMIGAWAHRHCGGDLARYVDVETGVEIQPIAIDAVTGAKLGTRAIRMNTTAI